MADITVVGGGLAGLVASIASAENGARVRLHEAHQTLGGRPAPARHHSSPTRARTSSTTTGRCSGGWTSAT